VRIFFFFDQFRMESRLITQADHENFAHQRCIVYIPRPSYFQTLDLAVMDTHLDNKKTPRQHGHFVAVVGESGSGKSSLLANWWRERTYIPDSVGNTPTPLCSVPHTAARPNCTLFPFLTPFLIYLLFSDVNREYQTVFYTFHWFV
jgi:hypothetical protein